MGSLIFVFEITHTHASGNRTRYILYWIIFTHVYSPITSGMSLKGHAGSLIHLSIDKFFLCRPFGTLQYERFRIRSPLACVYEFFFVLKVDTHV